jgi:hypothetical protein
MFQLRIDTDNAAFEDAPEEVARILRTIAKDLERYTPYTGWETVFDLNGNDVGRYRLSGVGGLVSHD